MSPRSVHRSLLTGVVALSLVAAATVATASGASAATTCRVKNLSTNVTKQSLQAAIDDAAGGATLRVRGQCVGNSVIDKDLTIVGERTQAAGKPILDGDHLERVLWVVADHKVSISDLTIRRGTPSGTSGTTGGGILNAGRLTLKNVIVRGNTTSDSGGGIASTGKLTLKGTTQIAYNSAMTGGGIFLSGGFGLTRLIMQGRSSVHHNTAAYGAGVANEGLVTMQDASSIRNNDGSANNSGGGIELWWTPGGVEPSLSMTDQSRVKNNTAGVDGGGVVTWPDCGLDPVVTGAGSGRVTGNTPANRVTSTGC